MVLSMTGFGKAEAEYQNQKIHVEIKSLNSKNMDINTHISPRYAEKDLSVRTLLTERLVRGKVDFTLWTEDINLAQSAPVNADVVAAYVGQIRRISHEQHLGEPSDWWTVLSRLPNITAAPLGSDLTDDEWQAVLGAIDTATDRLIEFRQQEGRAVSRIFTQKLENIARYLADVKQYEGARIDKIRQQIENGLRGLPDVKYDQGRLEQEMIYYIEKLDISEEKQRLTNHLRYFAETMERQNVQGKKLGFIAQEMGREINTLGSKSNQAEMQNLVVKMKDELEQIKEQVLNVL